MATIPSPPKVIRVAGDVIDLLHQIDESITRINERRPFDSNTEYEVRREFLPDRVTATLNIEGIGATRRQTLTILDAMAISQNAAKEEHEILNALRADEFVYNCAEAGAPLDAALIRETNRMLLDGVRRDAGEFRAAPVEISGATFRPPAPSDVGPMIQQYVQVSRDAEFIHPVIHAAWVHHQLSYIHPFMDGNGRTARLLQDFVLMRRGLFPIGVPSSQRDRYYQALQSADSGHWDDLVGLLAENELVTIGKVDAITRQPEERRKWIKHLAAAASSKKTGALHKQYTVWRARMEQVRDAFARAALEVDESSDLIGVVCRTYDTMEFDDWKRLATSGKRPPLTWSFSLLFFLEGEPLYKLIGFFRAHKSAAGDVSDALDGIVVLGVTGIPARSDERPDFVAFSDPDIRLREINFHADRLHAYYVSSDGGEHVDDKSIEDIVKDVMEDVFYRKGGLAP